MFYFYLLLQARKVFDDGGESLPGLIPARQLQQKLVHLLPLSFPLPNFPLPLLMIYYCIGEKL